MKVWQCDDLRPVPGFVSAEVERPTTWAWRGIDPGPCSWRDPRGIVVAADHTHKWSKPPPCRPGHEFSGTMTTGAGANGAVGEGPVRHERLVCPGLATNLLRTAVRDRTQAARLTHVEAASVPIDALTAWQGLFERAQLQAGERVLHSRWRRGGRRPGDSNSPACTAPHVLTTASGHDRDFLLQLGAQQVIDYHTERLEDLARNVKRFRHHQQLDVAALLGRAGFQRKTRYHCQHGQIGRGRRTRQQALFFVEPNRQQLGDVAMLDTANCGPSWRRKTAFDQAAVAYAREPVHTAVPARRWSR